MFKNIDHIGIAVENLDKAIGNYEKLLGTKCYKREIVESEQVNVAFFKTGESKLELLAPQGEGSAIARFLEKRGEGLHHIAYRVEDIESELSRLKKTGYRVLNETPKKGADGKWVAFIHPKDNQGVLVELCQSRDDN